MSNIFSSRKGYGSCHVCDSCKTAEEIAACSRGCPFHPNEPVDAIGSTLMPRLGSFAMAPREKEDA